MGSENWLLFKSPKEARRAELFLAPLGGEVGINGKFGCWLTWKGAKRLEIGVSAGSYRSEVHNFVQREICRRFDVRKIGSDSVGWYPDSDFVAGVTVGTAEYGYKSWAVWAKDFKPEWGYSLQKKEYWSPDRFEEDYAQAINYLKEIETFVVSQFDKLDLTT